MARIVPIIPFSVVVGAVGLMLAPLSIGVTASAADVWVSTSGDNKNSGDGPSTALASVEVAAGKAKPGDRIVLADGVYRPIKLVGLKGAAGKPIVMTTANTGKVTITLDRLDQGVAITLEQCEHVTVDGFHITKLMKGIDVKSSRHCRVLNNSISELGQEAIHVGRLHTYDGTEKFLGPASEHVEVIGNKINGTGKHAAVYGEGIYIGTGAFRGDDTHDILIERNTLTDISAEGIEIKPGTTRATVRGNLISNTHHEYNGAITVSVEGVKDSNGEFLIENNRIWNIRKVKHSVAGIAIGHGDAVIRNNLIWNVEGGIGIRVYETFSNPKALNVQIERNTVIAGSPAESILLHSGNSGGEASGLKARVQSKGNLTDDGSAGSQRATTAQFRGPFENDADAGQGPGSGFALRRKSPIGVDFNKLISKTTHDVAR